MTAPKTLVQWGYGAKIESAYGTINAVTTSDGILTKAAPVGDWPHWVNMGDRGNTPGAGSRQPAPKSGRWGGMKVAAEGIGFGAAYSAGNKPHLDVLVQSAGFSATGSFTSGQEYWLYTPATQPTALVSVTTEANLAGQLYRLYGAYSDLDIAANGPVIPDWNFDFIGAMDPVVDAAIPAYSSYPAIANVPMKADSIVTKLGLWTGVTLVVKSFAFKVGRNHKNIRVNQAGGFTQGMSGYTPGYRNPQITVVVERLTMATVTPWNTATTFNPYKAAEDAIAMPFILTVGATQYKRWNIFSGTTMTTGLPVPATQCVITDVKDTFEGPTATWTITFDFFPSTYGASDDFAIAYN